MARLPVPGEDIDNWGTLLNEFLLVGHNEDGTLQAYTKAQNEGDDLAKRSVINFVGPTIAATDDEANGRTTVTVSNTATYGSADETILQSTVNGETHPRLTLTAKGTLLTGDGTAAPGASNPATWNIQRNLNADGIAIKGAWDGTLKNLFIAYDYQNAPIAWISEAGGLGVNDNIYTNKGIFAPNGVEMDIYGNIKMLNCNMFAHAGPPGNRLTFEDSCFEAYQGDRGGRTGSWSAVFGSAALSTTTKYGAPNTPDGLFNQLQMKANNNATVAVVTAVGTNGVPVTGNTQYSAIATFRANTTGRQTQVSILWYTSNGTYLSSNDVNSSQTGDSSGAWTKVSVTGNSPATASFAAIKLTVYSPASQEIHYADAIGFYKGSNNMWSPPQVNQPNGSNAYGAARIGDRYFRSDTPTVANQREYICTVGGTPAQQTWIGIN